MSEHVEASVTLIDDKVRFSGTARLNPEISCDYHPPIGSGNGYTGLELFLVSLSACSATAVACLLRKSRKTVTGLKVTARGTRREQHPTCFETISLHFALQSPDAQDADLQKALKISEESLCPVWAMIKNNVQVVSSFAITN